MTARFERRPGSEETLLALYDVVVAAEELDLAEQADHERLWELSGARDQQQSAGAEESQEPEDTTDEDDRPSMSQVVGMIEHLLGGRPLGRIEPTA